MKNKKTFQIPKITTFERDELIVETAFTQAAPSKIQP
jgi:hypothetical protein